MDFFETEKLKERAVLAGVHTGAADETNDTTDLSIEELSRLAHTAGAEVIGTLIQNRPSPENSTYLGEGKLNELQCACRELDANLVIFDDELSPIQIKNIEKALNIRVIDRSMLILDIFARHAVTKEGKLQVELAQLKYTLPRLSGHGTELSRLGAGIGTKGPGETKLETDRRHIREKIHRLRGELEQIKKHRDLLRNARVATEMPIVALAGYTNSGKSTLLNTLTDAGVLAEDKLFATLDPTVRAYELSDGRKILLVDTVGFISKLPHHLIEAFKSTLEEVVFADVILNVVDASSGEYEKHIRVVGDVLNELSATGKPMICVFNKCDKKPEDAVLPKNVPGCEFVVEISAKTGYNIEKLLDALLKAVPGGREKVKLFIPYSDSSVLSKLHEEYNVLSTQFEDSGIGVTVMLDAGSYNALKKYISAP